MAPWQLVDMLLVYVNDHDTYTTELLEVEYQIIDVSPTETRLERVSGLHQKMVAIPRKFKAYGLVRSPEYFCTRSRLLIKTSMKEIKVATDRHTNELAALFAEYQIRAAR